jgi:hypothetical protein
MGTQDATIDACGTVTLESPCARAKTARLSIRPITAVNGGLGMIR